MMQTLKSMYKKCTLVVMMSALLSGCLWAQHGLFSDERRYWKADGTNYGLDGDEPKDGPEYVCFGTYASCEHMFTVSKVSTSNHEPPVSPIDPNSNLAPPLESLPGQ